MAIQLEAGLLGEIEISQGGSVVALSGPKAHAVLALLALAAPHPVSGDRLIDELWGDRLPTNPANSLQAHISAIRRVLGRGAIEHRGSGYVLAIGPEDVDTIRFERLVRAGRAAIDQGDHRSAAEHFTSALALVRGPPLAGLDEFRFARDTATRLEELIFSAHEGLAEARLADGDDADLVASLTGLVQAHPLRERLHGLLILALYRAGRQAEALRAYQDARRILIEELGVEPGSDLRELERAVLAQDPGLDRLRSPSVGAGAVPAPPSPAAPGRLPLAGRETELGVLRAGVDAAIGSRGQVVVVGGEPGVGKTRLVEDISSGATTWGLAVAWGRCHDGRGAPAFWPWTQVIETLLSRADPSEARRAIGSSAADLAQIAPVVNELVPDHAPAPPLDPDAAQFRLFQAVAGLVGRLAVSQPVLVVIDDLHWADRPSLDLLAFLASQIDRARVLVVGTYRNIDPALGGALAETLVTLGRRPSGRRIDLVGLDRAGLSELLTAAGAPPSEVMIDTIQRRTQGNPFFVTELLALHPEDGGSPSDPIGEAVPAGVKGVIRQRLAGLPASTVDALGMAAVLGQDFDLAVLVATLDLDGVTLLDRLEPAIEAGILVDNPSRTSRYRFSHGLVNETVYDDLGAGRRARMHHAIGQTLEAQHGDTVGPHLLTLAAHWFNAVPAAPADKAIDHAVRAAAWAQAHLAHQQAEEQLRAALTLLPELAEGRTRAARELEVQDLLSGLLLTSSSYSDPEFGRVCGRVRELCEELDDQALLLPAMWRLSIHHLMRADVDAGVALCRQLLDRTDADEAGAAQIAGHGALAGLIHERGDQGDARPHFERALALCDAGLDTVLVGSVTEEPAVVIRIFSAMNLSLMGEQDRADDEVVDAYRIAARDGDHTWTAAVSVWCSSMMSVFRDDAPTTLDRCDRGIELATAGGFGVAAAYVRANRGWARAALGEVDAGLAEIAEAAAVLEAFGARYMGSLFPALYAETCLRAGRIEEALASADRGLRVAEETGERWYGAELRRLRAEALALDGDHIDTVLTELDDASEIAVAQSAGRIRRRIEDTRSRVRAAP